MSSSCWQEGDLRAWLDRECGDNTEQISAHLAECPACQAACEELKARAMRVSALMAELAQPIPTPVRRLAPVRSMWRWVAPVAAIAACFALAAIVIVRNRSVKPVLQIATSDHPNPPSLLPRPAQPVGVGTPPAGSAHPIRQTMGRRVASHAAGRPPQPVIEESFQALDNEPIESGVIMRVGSPSGDVQADVIVGPDGRARAIRIVKVTAGT